MLAEGSVNFSAEMVRRICFWRSWMDNILMKRVEVERSGSIQVMMLRQTDP